MYSFAWFLSTFHLSKRGLPSGSGNSFRTVVSKRPHTCVKRGSIYTKMQCEEYDANKKCNFFESYVSSIVTRGNSEKAESEGSFVEIDLFCSGYFFDVLLFKGLIGLHVVKTKGTS